MGMMSLVAGVVMALILLAQSASATDELIKKRHVNAATDVFGNIIAKLTPLYDLLWIEFTQQTLEQSRNDMSEIKRQVEEFSPHVQKVLLDNAHLTCANTYNIIRQKIEFMLHYFMTEIRIDDERFYPRVAVDLWTEEVLSLSDSGFGRIVHDLHLLIIGQDIICPDSVFATFRSVLDSGLFRLQFKDFVEYTLSLQAAGYAMLANALHIKNGARIGIKELQITRMNIQNQFFSVLEPARQSGEPVWPTGSWGLPMPVSGCAAKQGFTWNTGSRFQDSEDSYNGNSVSRIYHLPGFGTNIEQFFCMKNEGGQGDWPAGDYCIFAGDYCPTGFSCGYIKWDDENLGNSNAYNGTLPRGTFDRDTLIYFACRNDGPTDVEIRLPISKPFYLFRYHESCQKVANSTVEMEWLQWDNEDDGNMDEKVPPHPYASDVAASTHLLHYCYYRPNEDGDWSTAPLI